MDQTLLPNLDAIEVEGKGLALFFYRDKVTCLERVLEDCKSIRFGRK